MNVYKVVVDEFPEGCLTCQLCAKSICTALDEYFYYVPDNFRRHDCPLTLQEVISHKEYIAIGGKPYEPPCD